MPRPSIVAMHPRPQDVDARLLVDLLVVVELGEREERHHHLLRQRQAGGVVERDVAAVGDDAVDELERRAARASAARSACRAPARSLLGMRGDHLVEDVVLVQGDDAEAPAGAAEVLAVRVDADRVAAETRRAASGTRRRRSRRRRRSAASGRDACSRTRPIAAIDSRLSATAYGLPGLTTKNALTFGSSSGVEILVGELPALLLRAPG